MTEFVVKDSGKREEFTGGMVRDTAEGKMRPDLVRDGPMFLRWVLHLTKGAVKYAARNWMLGQGRAEYERALESADRHFAIWHEWRNHGINIEDPNNPTTEPLKEDHAAAVFFNINQVEYLVPKLEAVQEEPGCICPQDGSTCWNCTPSNRCTERVFAVDKDSFAGEHPFTEGCTCQICDD